MPRRRKLNFNSGAFLCVNFTNFIYPVKIIIKLVLSTSLAATQTDIVGFLIKFPAAD